ncbi:ferrous iron transport protein B [Alkalibaculum bacchi]|uniref:Ferrous iron transport protein B n=1 Tax=Alkalibaculum bacchi TaxID=645887 RepID=A0A366ID89_9FIRM|nr:ferrous iron transport protein B [Alkalibaculum bacchi]RBP68898.1 ferrous iron transport protein B [Alkalibaculum bacchi]
MVTKIALAGNPNSGKTTLFNDLTGSNQYVGNWPGVTVEKKEGKIQGHEDTILMDLPGIYSLSPYTLEEVVTRNYLINEKPNAIINIIDGSNLERNLYLTTQLLELGIPVIVAINMMDIVKKRGDKIDTAKLSKAIGCEIVEITALDGTGTKELINKVVKLAQNPKKKVPKGIFSLEVEKALSTIEDQLPKEISITQRRWYAIKLFERDKNVLKELNIASNLDGIITFVENTLDDDSESIIINERYNYITKTIKGIYVKKNGSDLTTSDKVDAIITNRWLALPIFAVIMFSVYYISVTTVGTFVTDFTNDTIFGEWIIAPLGAWFESAGVSPWLSGLVVDGMVGGVGSVLGFVPQMFVLFFLLAILEECGYMSRVAFILDKLFRRFGLSGKSFIPMLIGTGCGVPGVMASRTIENEQERRMTIMTTTFMPCGAKLPIIALIAGALFGGAWWVAPSAYFLGIGAIVISGIILKKSKMFAGEPSPFVMELPAYHIPSSKSVLKSTWERGFSFVKRAGTVILLSSMIIWFLSNFGMVNGSFGMVEDMDHSILSVIGGIVAPLFAPLGFGNWQSAVATVMGILAKEEVVAVFGVLYGITGDALSIVEEGSFNQLGTIAAHFTPLAAYSFMIFNLLCPPCFAAIGAIMREMNNTKWTWFTIGYQFSLAYAVSLIFYQIGLFLSSGVFTFGTAAGFAVLIGMLYLIFRTPKTNETNKRNKMKLSPEVE